MAPGNFAPPRTLYTIGHSNRSWEAFLALLQKHAIGAVAAEEGADPVTQYYPGSALFSFTSTTGEVVTKLNQRATPEQPYQFTYNTVRRSGYDDPWG